MKPYPRAVGSRLTALRALAMSGASAMALTCAVARAETAPPMSAPPGGSAVVEEVVVTALQRSQKISQTPAAVSVITAAAIAEAGVKRADDFINLVPGVSLVNGAAEQGDIQVSIRGINSARDADPSFANVVDGIQLANPAAFNRDYFNVQQIEVLKGPQGAIYGRDAAAGAIIVNTTIPGDKFEGAVEASYGDYNSGTGKLYLAGPIAHNISASLTADYSTTDGQYTNSLSPNQPAADHYQGGDIAARVYFRIDPDTTFDFKARYGQLDAGAINYNAVFSLPAFASVTGDAAFYQNVNAHQFVYQQDVPGDNRQNTIEVSGKLDHDFGWAKLTGWALFSRIDDNLLADGTSASFGFFNTEPHCIASTAALSAAGVALPAPQYLAGTPGGSFFGPYTPTTCDGYQYQDRKQTDESFELRLASPSDGRLRWLAGLYFLHVDRNVGVATGIDDGGAPPRQLYVPNTEPDSTEQLLWDDFTTYVGSVFGQAQYDVTRDFEASFALRYDYEDRHDHNLVPTSARSLYIDFDGPPYTGGAPLNPGLVPALNPAGVHDEDKVFDQLEPKASLRWIALPELTVYGDWGVGFKSGGFNNEGSAATINTFINPVVIAAGFPAVEISDVYKKEVSSEFEVGAKSVLFDNRLTLDGALYHNDVHNMQFFEFFVGPFGLLRVVDNIDLVRLEGAELSADYKAARYFDIGASGSYIHSRIDANSVRPDTVGNKAPYTPDYTWNVFVQYNPYLVDTVRLLARVDVRGTGPTWFHTVQNQSNPTVFEVTYGALGRANYGETQREAFTLVNLRIGLQRGPLTVTGYATNLFDKNYLSEVIPAPEFGGAFVSPGQGRRYGVQLDYKF
jgi:iron complex outermembrane receptor protein